MTSPIGSTPRLSESNDGKAPVLKMWSWHSCGPLQSFSFSSIRSAWFFGCCLLFGIFPVPYQVELDDIAVTRNLNKQISTLLSRIPSMAISGLATDNFAWVTIQYSLDPFPITGAKW
jgi:hypothetical protein